MPKSRIPSTRRKSRVSATARSLQRVTIQRFAGLSLSGGRNDKACLVFLEVHKESSRVFLSRLIEKIKSEELISADQKIFEMIQQQENSLFGVAVDTPLTLPVCLNCELKCPGYEACSVEDIVWLRNFYQKLNQQKKPKRGFTPYTQRPLDTYLAFSDDGVEVHHALGANLAPLTARALFISRRHRARFLEVQTKISYLRLAQQLGLMKSQSQNHRHFLTGESNRKAFLQALIDKRKVFIYEQDLRILIENNHAFDAFLCSYVLYLQSVGLTQKKPADLPGKNIWALVPEKSE